MEEFELLRFQSYLKAEECEEAKSFPKLIRWWGEIL